MSNLKLELDEYLNKNQKNRAHNGHHVHIPKVFKKLLNSESGEQTENLLDSTKTTYFNFPQMVRYNFISVELHLNFNYYLPEYLHLL